MALFDDIKTGLNQAIAYEKGEIKPKQRIITVAKSDKSTATYSSDNSTHANFPNALDIRGIK